MSKERESMAPAQPNGYDSLTESELIKHLLARGIPPGSFFPHCLAAVGSTNDYLRTYKNAPHGMVVTSERQTSGKGRLGRAFFSPKGGLYFSVLYRPAISTHELMPLPIFTAVAVCNAIERLCGFRPTAKWPNDIEAGGKKLSGILTEMSIEAETGVLKHVVIGIGINITQTEYPEGINATSIKLHSGITPSRAELCAAILAEPFLEGLCQERGKWLEQYRKDCTSIGSRVYVTRGSLSRSGLALEVDDNGALIVAFDDGCVENVNSGEVTLAPASKFCAGEPKK